MKFETILERKIRTAPVTGNVIHVSCEVYKDAEGKWWKKQVHGPCLKWHGNKLNKAEKKAQKRATKKLLKSMGYSKGCNTPIHKILAN